MLYGGRKRGRKSYREVLVLREAGVSVETLASLFSVTPMTVRKILCDERKRRALELEYRNMPVRGLGVSFGFVDGHGVEVKNGV